MIDAYDLYQDFCSLVNTFMGGHFRPNTDFIRQANNVSTELWELYAGEAETSQRARDNMSPYLKSKNLIANPQASFYSIANFPADYGRFATAGILVAGGNKTVADKSVDDGKCLCDGELRTQEELTEEYYNTVVQSDVKMIDNQRWHSMLKHASKYPTYENPKLTQINNQLQIAPRGVGVIVLNYYVRPKEATFVYTVAPGNVQTGAGDQIIYNAAASQKFEWSATLKPEFLWRLGERFGLFTRDQFIAQWGMLKSENVYGTNPTR